MKVLLALTLAVLAASVDCVPIEEFARFGPSNTTDMAVETGDDTSARLPLPGTFPYFGDQYTTLYVTTNGAVSFDEDMDRFTPTQLLDEVDEPIITPFWADADTRGSGAVYYRVTENDPYDESFVLRHLDQAFPQHLPFNPSYIIVVTWYQVGYFDRGSDLTNTFQLVLSTDGMQSFAFFIYLDGGIQWVFGDVNAGLDGLNSEGLASDYPQAGFSSGDSMMSHDLIVSGDPQIAIIDTLSNLGLDGFFAFRIDGPTIIPAIDIECGNPPLGNTTGGLDFILLNGTTNYLSVAMYICMDEGYAIVGNIFTTCQENLTWSSASPFCQFADCLDPPLPDPADTEVTPMIDQSPPDATTFGTVATYSCQLGYRIVGNGTRECQVDSQWSGVTPFCEIGQCVKEELFPADRSGLIIDAPLCTVNSTAQHFCLREYMLIGDVNRTCMPNESWSGSEPTRCELIDCSITDPQMSDGILEFTFDPNSELDGVITYTCIPGYILMGDVMRTCQSDGFWNGTAPTCMPVDCGDPPSDNSTNLRVSFTMTTFQSVAVYSCNETGLEVVGDDTIVCLASGNWSRGNEIPICEPVRCPNLTVIFPLMASPMPTGVVFGDIISFSCPVGYNLQGDMNLTCTASGTYSAPQPTCEIVDCMALTVMNPGPGNLVLSQPNGTTYLEVTIYACDVGYNIIGDMTRTCQADGMWNGTEPVCEIVTCQDLIINPPLIANSSTTGIVFNESVHFECPSGFILRGHPYITCTEFGNYTALLPTCEAIDCGVPMDEGMDDQRIVMPMNETTFNVTRFYSCMTGYILNGSDTRTCESNEMWSGIPPFCNIVDCGEPMDEVNNPQRLVMPADVTTFNTTRIYTCITGYNLTGSDMRTCQANSSWSGTPPFCEPVDCGVLTITGSPVGGLALSQPDGTEYLNTTIYTCDVNYNVVGDMIRTCQANGTWSGEEPMCVEIMCPPLTATPPLIVMNPAQRVVDQVARYTCVTGYEQTSPAGSELRICQADMSWSGGEPICEIVSCGTPGDEDGTDPFLEVMYTALTFNSSRTYTCNNTNYTIIEGDAVRTCQADGTWSGNPPRCTFVNCGLPSISNDGNTDVQNVTITGLLLGDITIYSCDPGFEIAGGDEIRTCQLNPVTNEYEWSGEPGYCEIVSCGRDILVVGETFFNGRRIEINTTFTNDVFESVVTYECENGFTIIGDVQRVCQANGTWSGEGPTMCQIVDCEDPPLPMGEQFNNISVTFTNTTFNSTAVYSCPDGFAPDIDDDIGLDETRTCLGNGQWSTPTPTCVAQLSAGAIAGIVIGSLVGLLLLILLIVIIILVIALAIKKATGSSEKIPPKPITNEGHESIQFDPVDPDQGEKDVHLHFADDDV